MKTTSPLVSIIIPTYNSDTTIIQAIESVFKQSFTDYEVIVIDDGSTDKTKEILSEYINQHKIVYQYQKNTGCGAARNAGIALAKGVFIAFLDSDDCWDQKKLETQIAVFNDNPSCVVCYGEVRTFTGNNNGVQDVTRTPITKPRSGKVLPYFIFHNIITLSSAVVRKDLLQKVGNFDEDRKIMYVEDYDLWLKLAPLGTFYFTAEPLTFYRLKKNESLSAKQSHINHKKILHVFSKRLVYGPSKVKPWYALGLGITFIKHALYPFQVLKKLGVINVFQEVKRRILLRVHVVFYPLLVRRLVNKKFDDSKTLCDFAYNKTFGILIPGQIKSEIKTFLSVLFPLNIKNVLEVGTAHGGNLFLLTKIAENTGKIISIDLPGGEFGGGYFEQKKYVYENFATEKQKVFLFREDSHTQSVLRKVEDVLGGEKLDLLFIDADHTYEGVKKDFEMYSPLVRTGGIVAFHDIAKSPAENYGVEKFWNEIKDNFKHQEIIEDPDQLGYGIGVLYF